MTFVQRARDFIERPGQEHLAQPRYPIMRDTLNFMLAHAIGRANAISTDNIIRHLTSRGHRIGRENWQINILGYLREHGVFIGALRGRGMFIINDPNDAREAYDSIRRRIEIEQHRLQELGRLIREEGWGL